MEKQDPFFELITDIITSSIQTICFLSPLAVFLAYFMFKDRVNATTDFFLHWTSISILTVIIGSLLQSISTNYYSTKKRILVAFVGAIGQSLIMTYLFATYQPGLNQMSRIYMLSWISSPPLSTLSGYGATTSKAHSMRLLASQLVLIPHNYQNSSCHYQLLEQASYGSPIAALMVRQ